MAWAVPQHSREDLNTTGKLHIEGATGNMDSWDNDKWLRYFSALDVINNWRSAHGYPLNTLQVNLRGAVRRFDRSFLVAQRTKRLVSITAKLVRFPKMKLSQMQDIGGCRACREPHTYEGQRFDASILLEGGNPPS
jgi:hypothetical protein